MFEYRIKFFSLGFILGLMLLAVIVLPIEYGIRNDSNIYSVKNENFLANINDIQILVLGSSHSLFGLSAQTLSKRAFNLSNVNQTYNYDEAFIKKYIDKMPNLRVVILSLSPFSLAMQMGGESINFRQYYYKHFMDIVPDGILLDKSFDKNFLQNFSWTFSLGFMRSIKDIYADFLTVKIDNYGDYDAPIGNAQGFKNHGEQTAKRHGNPMIKSEVLQSIKNIKAMLDKNGVQLLLVTTPTLHFYNQAYSKQAMDDFYATVLQKLNLTRTNLFSDFYGDENGYEFSDFHDPDHLSKPGAIKFSSRVREHILKHQNIFGQID